MTMNREDRMSPAEVMKRIMEFAKEPVTTNTIYDVPRQVGKTTKLLKEFLKRSGKCIIIVPNDGMKLLLQSALKHKLLDETTVGGPVDDVERMMEIIKKVDHMMSRTFTLYAYKRGQYAGLDYDTILFEEIFFQNKTELMHLFYHLGQEGKKFIAFGTDYRN